MKPAPVIRTPEAYLASLPEPRQGMLRTLDRAIRRAVPKLEPHFSHGLLAYGRVRYRTRSGCEGDWFVVGLASQKNYVSLYLCACDASGYLAEQHRRELGRVSVGRSCVRFKRLEDLNLKVALALVKRAARLAASGPGGAS